MYQVVLISQAISCCCIVKAAGRTRMVSYEGGVADPVSSWQQGLINQFCTVSVGLELSIAYTSTYHHVVDACLANT
jgi:hypothetical protein